MSLLVKSIKIHCDGNPFSAVPPLRNMMSSMVIPDSVHSDIIERDEKGQHEYKQFIENRLVHRHLCGIV